MDWDRLYVIGRNSARAYLRLYPNFGFMLRIFGREFKWSRFYGFKCVRAK